MIYFWILSQIIIIISTSKITFSQSSGTNWILLEKLLNTRILLEKIEQHPHKDLIANEGKYREF